MLLNFFTTQYASHYSSTTFGPKHNRLKRSAKVVKLSPEISKQRLEVATTILDLHPSADSADLSLPSSDEVKETLVGLVPPPMTFWQKHFIEAPLFPVTLARDVTKTTALKIWMKFYLTPSYKARMKTKVDLYSGLVFKLFWVQCGHHNGFHWRLLCNETFTEFSDSSTSIRRFWLTSIRRERSASKSFRAAKRPPRPTHAAISWFSGRCCYTAGKSYRSHISLQQSNWQRKAQGANWGRGIFRPELGDLKKLSDARKQCRRY